MFKLFSKENLENLKCLLGDVFKKYKVRLIVVMVLIVVSSLTSIAASMFLKSLIDDYITPMLSQNVPDFTPLLKALVQMACIYLAGTLANFLYNQLMIEVTQKTIMNFRNRCFRHLQTLPISYFDKNSHGNIMSIFTNDIDTLNNFLSTGLTTIVSTLLTMIVILLAMIYTSPILSIITLIYLVVTFRVVGIVGKLSGKYYAEQQKTLGSTSGFIEEVIEGTKVIKVFNHEEKIAEEFDQLNEVLREHTTLANRYGILLFPITFNIANLQYVLIAILGALLALNGFGLSVGSLAAFLQLSKAFSGPFNQLSQQLAVVNQGLAGLERIFKLLREDSEIDEGKITLKTVCKVDGKIEECSDKTGSWAWKKEDGTLVPLMGDIRFYNVNFSYEKDHPILKDISLFAKPGQKLAFVGKTGAGKTTITNLINRFYEIDSGTITYDGIDIRDIKKDDLRKSLGIVLQDTHLFTGTIRENLRYGNPFATEEEIIKAAKDSHADYFIQLLPEGYDTVISGKDSTLSEGQKQLLSIARADVSDPPVMILDEATSSIDSRTEALVQQSMDNIMEGRTVFVIAHRLSTVRNSNAIIVLENGEIVERGDHDELMELKGVYYNLNNSDDEDSIG